jgi:hypothetical protein
VLGEKKATEEPDDKSKASAIGEAALILLWLVLRLPALIVLALILRLR